MNTKKFVMFSLLLNNCPVCESHGLFALFLKKKGESELGTGVLRCKDT